MSTTSASFAAGWYRIAEGAKIVADPAYLSGGPAVDEFVAETRRNWPGGGQRDLQLSANQSGPWSTVAQLA